MRLWYRMYVLYFVWNWADRIFFNLFSSVQNQQGITTYEYVVAMRAMSEAPAGASIDEEMPNMLYSPSGSATTGFSGGSSLGLPYKGAWCTPPRVFVDYQVSFASPRIL